MAVDYGEDFLQRIVGVHWRTPGVPTGGVFIAGEHSGNVHFLRIGPGAKIDNTTGLPAWQNLGKLGPENLDRQGSAYALVERGGSKTPVFVLVGGTGGSNGVGVIMVSSDGLNWQQVYTQTASGGPVSADRNTGNNIFGVVWDEQAKSFFAGAHQSFGRQGGDPKLYECDILLQSVDGSSWNEIERVDLFWDSSIVPSTGYPPYPKGLLVDHCNTRVTDPTGNAVPDGMYKYDPESKIMIAPISIHQIDYLFGQLARFDFSAGEGVNVTKFAVNPTPIPLDPGFPTICVAGVGNSWMAGGGIFGGSSADPGICNASYLAPSVEKSGIRWLPLNPSGVGPIVTMVGGQAKPPPL